MKINESWHKQNKLPKNPTFEQRLAWHTEHTKNCGCRKPAGKILEEMRRRKLL